MIASTECDCIVPRREVRRDSSQYQPVYKGSLSPLSEQLEMVARKKKKNHSEFLVPNYHVFFSLRSRLDPHDHPLPETGPVPHTRQ